MQSRQRYVVTGILGLGILISMVLGRGLQWLWLRFSWPDPLLFSLEELSLTAVLGYAIGLGMAAAALLHQPTRHLATEVVDELARVSWPSREETGQATIVVVAAVVICSAYLGLFDACWLWLTDWILGVPGQPTGS